MMCLGTMTIATTLATIVVGLVTPEKVKTYVSLNIDPWDNNQQINFQEPMGSLGIEYDYNKHTRIFAEHISSPMQCDDHPGINHAGVKLLAPIGDLTLYSGLSYNNSYIDSNDKFSSPLTSLGFEYGDTVKLYAEYLVDIDDIDEGRFSTGFKVFFK